MRKTPLHLESLETRDCPSNIDVAFMIGTRLYDIVQTANGSKTPVVASLTPGAAAGQVNVSNNDGAGGTFSGSFSGVASISIVTSGYHDYVYNGTTIAALIGVGQEAPGAGTGYNSVFSKAAGSSIHVTTASGHDVIQDTAGKSRLVADNDYDAIFGGTGDNDALNGDHAVYYNIVGANTITLGAHTQDFLNVNFAGTENGVVAGDLNANDWFNPATGAVPNAFALIQFNGVLYATMDGAGDTFTYDGTTATLTSPTAGTLTIVGSFQQVGVFGGAGNDTITVGGGANGAVYGQGGVNVETFSGGAAYEIAKTGNAGSQSTLNGSIFNYATGAPTGADTIRFTNPNAYNVLFSPTGNDTQTEANLVFGTPLPVLPLVDSQIAIALMMGQSA